MTWWKRAVGSVAASVLAGGIVVLAGGPASADQSDCMDYVRDHGYIVGDKVASACAIGEFDVDACVSGLWDAGVARADAEAACARAPRALRS